MGLPYAPGHGGFTGFSSGRFPVAAGERLGPLRAQFILVNRGAARLPTGSDNASFTAVYTNLTDGRLVTLYGQDQQVIDNGDGTLTIHEKAVGPLRVVGPDGKLFAIDTAVLAFDILLDDNGTPYDPFDDTFISQSDPVVVAGRSVLADHDYCADVISQIG